jgi:hypothetical protein
VFDRWQPETREHKMSRIMRPSRVPCAATVLSTARRSPVVLCVLSVAIAVMLVGVSSAHDEIELRVRPRICDYGSPLWIDVRIEPSGEDRYLFVDAESPEFYRSSAIQLEGADGPSVHRVILRRLPPGTYQVRAELQQADQTFLSDPRVVTVVGPAPPGQS